MELCRMDVPRYKAQNLLQMNEFDYHRPYYWKNSTFGIGDDTDADAIDDSVRARGRYFSGNYAALEHDKGLKRIKVIEKLAPSGDIELFIPLGISSRDDSGSTPTELVESWEDEMIRRTREFNRMSRESPHDEKVWMSFAEFQDKIASTQRKKAARFQTLEKKISILEKAVELNPDKEELILYLLRSYRERDTSELLLKKWQNILAQHSDSVGLWKEYLLLYQSEFSQFKVSELRKRYSYAIQALSSVCAKLHRQDTNDSSRGLPDSSLVQTELGIVEIFVSLCRFEWQTGHHELATGLFQAQIEYSLFSPTLQLTESSKLRLFEHFWSSGASRIGEDGAVGWSTWIAKDEVYAQNKLGASELDISEDAKPGGWTGWFDPSLKNGVNQENTEFMDPAASVGADEDNMDVDGIQTEEDIGSLLKKLGVDVDTESNGEVKDTETWLRWSAEEVQRDNQQWMPVHENTSAAQVNVSGQEEHEQLSRVILFQDVADFLFSLSSEGARLSLLYHFLDFYGGKHSQRASSNSSCWLEKILSLDVVPDSIMEELTIISDFRNKNKYVRKSNFEFVPDIKNDLCLEHSMIKFLRNVTLHCLSIFPRNQMLEEALLLTEEADTERGRLDTSANVSRSLAKNLLKKDRQDFILCGIYARSEASRGNIEQARRIFDMALLSVDGTYKEQDKLALIYFWYAEMEMGLSNATNCSESLQRVVYILSCLGGNSKYAPFSCVASGPQILIARQGFKEHIRALRLVFASGTLNEHSVAYICSAALFEALTSGISAGLEIIEESFSTTLPGRRSKSSELEFLWVYYVGLVLKYLNQLCYSRLWSNLHQGIHVYPFNPKSYVGLLALCCSFGISSRVRLELDKCIQRNPSVVAFLFALCFDWERAEARHRIHGLFERAMADEKLQKSVLLWRCYLAYEAEIACNSSAAKRVFFRAIHACPWSKRLWLDGFQKLSSVLTVKELSDLQEVMRDKELNIRTDIYEILLQDEMET